MKLTKLLTSLSAFTLVATAVSAQAVIYESFDYSTGALSGNTTSGIGTWTSSGSNQQQVVSPGLSFTNLSTTGNAARRTSAPGGAVSNVSIDASARDSLGLEATSSPSTIYFSLLLRNDRFSVPNEDFVFVIGSGNIEDPGTDKQNATITGGDGFGVHMDGNTDGGDTIDIFGYQIDGGAASQSTGKIDNDNSVNTFMIAGQIDWAPNGSNDTLTLFNISDAATGSLPTAFATMSADLDQSTFDTLGIHSRQVGTIDEIRFGTSWSDVGLTAVPEPSSFALMAGFLGLIWVMLRRRS